MGGNITQLNDSLRPADILQQQTSINEWDGFFPVVLGRYASTSTNFNYYLPGNPLAVGTPALRHYAYNEFELYAQDTWRIRQDLTLSPVCVGSITPCRTKQDGFESVPNIDEQTLFSARLAAANAGIQRQQRRSAHHLRPGRTEEQRFPDTTSRTTKTFAPKLGLAYAPSFSSGWRGKLFGDRKTVIRAGAGIVYDRVLNTLEFELDQENFLFSNNVPQTYGTPGRSEHFARHGPALHRAHHAAARHGQPDSAPVHAER